MIRITNKINDELIDIREFAKPNACFQTNEYPDSYDFCILHEQFNPFDLVNDNKIKDKEIERYKNIINELVLSCYDSDMSLAEFENIWEIAFNKKYNPKEIDKLKELKERE